MKLKIVLIIPAIVFLIKYSYSQDTKDSIVIEVLDSSSNNFLNNYYTLGSIKLEGLICNGDIKLEAFSINLGYKHFYNDKKNAISINFKTIKKQNIKKNSKLNSNLFPFSASLEYLYQIKEKKVNKKKRFYYTIKNSKKTYTHDHFKIPITYKKIYYLNAKLYYNQLTLNSLGYTYSYHQIQSAYLFLGLTKLKFKSLTYKYELFNENKYDYSISEHSIGLVYANYHNNYSWMHYDISVYGPRPDSELETKYIKHILPKVLGINFLWNKKYFSNKNFGSNLYFNWILLMGRDIFQVDMSFGLKVFLAK